MAVKLWFFQLPENGAIMKISLRLLRRGCAALLVVVGLLCLALPPQARAGRLRALTTIRPLYAFTVQVAGEAATVESLLPPGVGPHNYALRPSDAARLHGADVLVINGLGLETWLEGAVDAVGKPGLIVIDTSVGIKPLPLRVLSARRERRAEAGRHAEGRWDPHIWLDPVRAIRQVENIRDGLARADPASAAIYAANAKEAIGRLEALHGEMAVATARFRQRELMTFHTAFQYFARRYGLSVVAVVEDAPGKEPTPKFLARLHKLIERHGLRVIYTEPQYRSRVAEVLARDMGLEVAELDPGVTGPLGPEAYEAVMRQNLKVLSRFQSP